MGKFVIKSTMNGQWHFTLKANNGETILSSETYTTLAACENGITSVKTNAPIDARYDRKSSLNGKYYFTLKASNFQVIGTSEMYNSVSARDAGIQSVKTNAPNALIEREPFI
jgi:uncharacterized protein YegP (UPF0339 family)